MSDVEKLLAEAIARHFTWVSYTEEQTDSDYDEPEKNAYRSPRVVFSTDSDVPTPTFYTHEATSANGRGTMTIEAELLDAGGGTLSAGRLFFMTVKGSMGILDDDYALFDGRARRVKITYDEELGTPVPALVAAGETVEPNAHGWPLIFDGVYLPIHLHYDQWNDAHEIVFTKYHHLTFFDLATLYALADAEADGRSEDAEALLLLFDSSEYHMCDVMGSLSAEQLDHLCRQVGRPGDDSPMTIRSGKVFTQLMRGATRGTARSIALTDAKGEPVTRISAIADSLKLKPSTRKTLTYINHEATRMSLAGEYRHDGESVCRVELSVKETAQRYGIGEETARKRLRRDFKDIANQKISFKRGKSWVELDISGGIRGVSGDTALFTISPDFMRLVIDPKAAQVDLPPELFATDDQKYPAAFQIGAKLYTHSTQNEAHGTPDRLKLTTLLKASTEIPSAAKLSSRYSKTERIMKPFEASMNHLVEIGALADWDYCHECGEPLTDAEQDRVEIEHSMGRPCPYELAVGLLVTWELARVYEDRRELRQAARDRNRARAMEAKAERERADAEKERRINRKVENLEAKRRAEASGGTPDGA